MVYCTKCGTKNEEDAVMCVECGASLVARPPWRRKRKQPEKECFGLPHGGAIAGVIIGMIIILVGVSSLLEIELWDYLWALLIVVVGILLVAGALYSYTRR